MRSVINALNRVPRLKSLLKRLYHTLRGEAQIAYSRITPDLIQRCVNKPNPTILDIGCNDGSEVTWFLQIFERPRIFCFEPDPRAVQRFKKAFADHANVSLFEMALSDRDGEITFHQSSGGPKDGEALPGMSEDWDLSGSIRRPKQHLAAAPGILFERTLKVRTSTLDTWSKEQSIETIDFVWMDVQGAESDVLRGGREALAKTRFVYTEYSDRQMYDGQLSLRQLLKQLHHFKVLVRYPDDVLLYNEQMTGPIARNGTSIRG